MTREIIVPYSNIQGFYREGNSIVHVIFNFFVLFVKLQAVKRQQVTWLVNHCEEVVISSDLLNYW